MVVKPEWLTAAEQRIADKIPLHPNVISSIKLVLVTPAMFFSFRQTGILPNSAAWIFLLFVVFCLLDYLDGIVARHRDLESSFGRIYDRFTDYPLLFIISYHCTHVIQVSLILSKLALDCLLLIQFAIKAGTLENRIRTTIAYTTLVSLLFLSQGWSPRHITSEVVTALLLANIAFNATVGLYNARIFQLRFVADALSAANLLCGLIGMYFAYRDRLEISLLFLLLGGVFDGFDGAAARKWGGTRWGVYSDDVADGVNYGITPGVALFFMIGGWEGAVSGFLYTFFTISRLVFFTLNKEAGDPNFFCGVPSTIGGLMVLCALILLRDTPVLMGLLVGMACVQMVSFDVHYKHLGRAVASRKKRYVIGLPMYALLLILGAFIWGSHVSIALLLIVVLGYGFAPSLIHMKKVITRGLQTG